MPTLAEIRENLRKEQEQKNKKNTYSGDNAIFPHWLIKEDDSVRVRFLPDADQANPYGFWQLRFLINLTFSGVKGDSTSKPCFVKVPCMENWHSPKEDLCPILREVRPWFNSTEAGMEDLGKKYWKKKSFLMQGFVIEKPEGFDEEPPENPIRQFIFTPQIHEIAGPAALMDPEMIELPTHYEAGLDFMINKTPGNYGGSYTTSKYVRNETALNQFQLDAIEEYGLNDLKSLLPQEPTEAHLQAQKEMFEASLDGELYDAERWGEFYRPRGVDKPTTPEAENADAPKTETVDEITTSKAVEEAVEAGHVTPPVEAPVVETKVEEAAPVVDQAAKAKDLLSQIRTRKANAATTE